MDPEHKSFYPHGVGVYDVASVEVFANMEAQLHLDMSGFGRETGLMWKESNGKKGKIMTTYNSYSNFSSKEEKGNG